MTQPHVVDLLVSFCYSAAASGTKLQTFPTGLGLLVPPIKTLSFQPATQNHAANGSSRSAHNCRKESAVDETQPGAQQRNVKFHEVNRELIFESNEACPVRVGDWIVLQTDLKQDKHCRIMSTTFYPTVKVSQTTTAPAPNIQPLGRHSDTKDEEPLSVLETFKFYIYNQNFDHLDDVSKRESILQLLDLLPSVQELRDHLKWSRRELSAWVDRISPALAGLLRWIIASSRACIFQVDDLDASEADKTKRAADRLYGMPGWMQFRFAMGAPDKERRFIDAVNSTSTRLKQAHPTIFAWHGSPLVNWHSIIREGLHYNYVASGRAFGDGCYHSLHFATSSGYAGSWYNGAGRSRLNGWPQSRLQMTSAMALSEIVNAPKEFRSCSPHLVVQHLDWIQTRYLFVQCGNPEVKLEDVQEPPTNIHPQDQTYTPQGAANSRLIIPAGAVHVAHRPQSRHGYVDKLKSIFSGTKETALLNDSDETASIQTLEEDLEIFQEEDVPCTAQSGSFGDASISMTDFKPGHLDLSSLPILQPPSYATAFATKRLLGDFQALVKLQKSQPMHQLGWYLSTDPDLMNNLYQWIVELHTFDPSLPLAKEMKSRGITSVVLEIRFGNDFPISPPFLRVIRPRFLGFQQGGGGHVTLGGAICMELLTNNGWTAACTIDSVLLQVKLAMESVDPRPARLAHGHSTDYGIGEAVEAFERACRAHGWTIPSNLRNTTQDTSRTGS